MHALQQWLLNHNEYSHLLKSARLSTRFDSDYDIDFLNESVSHLPVSLLNNANHHFRALFDDLQHALLQAITSSPERIDADLQVGRRE